MRNLVPTGTARDAVLALRRDVPGPRLQPAFPRDLLAGASAWEDGPELLQLAWELARCAPEASPQEQRALVLLAFAALAGLREGSTRIPVRGPLAEALQRDSLAQVQALRGTVTAYKALGGGWPAEKYITQAQAR